MPGQPNLDPHEREATLAALLREHPTTIVAAMQNAAFVEMPTSVPVAGHRVLGAERNPLDQVPAAEVDRLALLWTEAEEFGFGTVVVHWRDAPTDVSEVVLVDVRETHGVFVGVVTPATSDETTPGAVVAASVPLVARVRKNVQAVILDVDPAFTEMFGWTADEARGSRTIDLADPEDGTTIVAKWLALLAQPDARYGVRFRHRRSDGSTTWVDMVSWFVSEDEIVSEIVDVSDEMEALQQAWAHQQMLDQLADVLPVGVLEIDRDAQVRYTNARLHQILGVATATTCATSSPWSSTRTAAC